MNLDDVEVYDINGNKLTPRQLLEDGVSRGFARDGQALLTVMMDGKLQTWTMLALSKETFIKVMGSIADVIYK